MIIIKRCHNFFVQVVMHDGQSTAVYFFLSFRKLVLITNKMI